MRRIAAIIITIILLIPSWSFAQQNGTTFQSSVWKSKNANDSFTIQNGAGTMLTIVISVDNAGPHADGVTVSNCGSTTFIKAGSSTVCQTNDSADPVTLTSNSVSLPSSGTYQIKQK